jgi:2-desacetyl-2-hydroxyethyl bacteriochlorophyllide A dehydrogenase
MTEEPGTVRVGDRPSPVLVESTDAIVEVEYTGVCGTDIHVVRGDLPGVPPGTVLGHEIVGRVAEIGVAVTSISVGQRVVASDFVACGRCWHCRRREHWHCPHREFFGTGESFGPTLSGGQSERVRVPFADTTLGVVPDEVDPVLAVLIADNFPTGFAAAARSRIRPGDVVAVVGGGMVGQLAAISAQLHGAAAVVVSDPVAQRRQAAVDTGNLSAKPQALVEVLHALTQDRGADVVIEAVGGSVGMDASLRACRAGGRVTSVSAHMEPSWAFPLADAFAREISMRFVIGNPLHSRDRLFSLAASGLLAPVHALMERRPLREAAEAYSDVRHTRALKVVLTL